MSGKLFQRFTRYSEFYCGTFKSILLGLKELLKTQNFENKVKVSIEQKKLTFFTSIIEHD